MQSKTETEFASSILGLKEEEAPNVPKFVLGQGIFFGRWVADNLQLNAKISPARIKVGGGDLPETWKEPPETTPDVENSPEAFIVEMLNRSPHPIKFPSLAQAIQDEYDIDTSSGWFNYKSLKECLMSFKNADIKYSSEPPGYVYLNSKHDTPTNTYFEESNYSDSEKIAIDFAKNYITLPFGEKETYGAIFKAISQEIHENQFNLTDTSKNVRDKCVNTGFPVGRNLVNAVLQGIYFSGHVYDSDVDQSPETLAKAYVKSIFYALTESGAKPDAKIRKVLTDLLSGGIISDNEKDPSDGS